MDWTAELPPGVALIKSTRLSSFSSSRAALDGLDSLFFRILCTWPVQSFRKVRHLSHFPDGSWDRMHLDFAAAQAEQAVPHFVAVVLSPEVFIFTARTKSLEW